MPSAARPLNSRGGSLQAGVIRSGAGRSGGPARAVDADVALMKGFSGASRRLRCPTLLPGMVGMALRVRTGVRATGAAGAAGGVAGAALATGVSRGVTLASVDGTRSREPSSKVSAATRLRASLRDRRPRESSRSDVDWRKKSIS